MEKLNEETKRVIAVLKMHVGKTNYEEHHKLEAFELLDTKYNDFVKEHLKTIQKLKHYDENVEELIISMCKILDKAYIKKEPKPKKVLTEEQKEERRKKEQERRKKAQDEPIQKPKPKKTNNKNFFAIPILRSIK